MENASKALLMAAGVLIGILVLSLAIFLFSNFGTVSSNMRDEIESNQLTQFNSQFTVYAGRDDITIYDIITVANLAKENNNKYEGKNDFVVSVIFNPKKYVINYNLQRVDEAYKKIIIEDYSTVTSDKNGRVVFNDFFKCNNITYHENGRVASITFEKTQKGP